MDGAGIDVALGIAGNETNIRLAGSLWLRDEQHARLLAAKIAGRKQLETALAAATTDGEQAKQLAGLRAKLAEVAANLTKAEVEGQFESQARARMQAGHDPTESLSAAAHLEQQITKFKLWKITLTAEVQNREAAVAQSLASVQQAAAAAVYAKSETERDALLGELREVVLTWSERWARVQGVRDRFGEYSQDVQQATNRRRLTAEMLAAAAAE